jgi:hypothetical protein
MIQASSACIVSSGRYRRLAYARAARTRAKQDVALPVIHVLNSLFAARSIVSGNVRESQVGCFFYLVVAAFQLAIALCESTSLGGVLLLIVLTITLCHQFDLQNRVQTVPCVGRKNPLLRP